MAEHDYAPVTLSVLGPDGRFAPVVKEGGRLPASVRLVFATQRPGQRELSLSLYEGEDSPDAAALVAEARAQLPAGLPANCWLQVYVEVSAALAVRVRVRENLRRIDVDAELDDAGATAEQLHAG
jgi:hypothetical protein